MTSSVTSLMTFAMTSPMTSFTPHWQSSTATSQNQNLSAMCYKYNRDFFYIYLKEKLPSEMFHLKHIVLSLFEVDERRTHRSPRNERSEQRIRRGLHEMQSRVERYDNQTLSKIISIYHTLSSWEHLKQCPITEFSKTKCRDVATVTQAHHSQLSITTEKKKNHLHLLTTIILEQPINSISCMNGL